MPYISQYFAKNKPIPAYLERSRSGKGGQVSIFFDEPYSARKSRKNFISLLEQVRNLPLYLTKAPAFDRLFPNQDLS